jgi:hypothetical protein
MTEKYKCPVPLDAGRDSFYFSCPKAMRKSGELAPLIDADSDVLLTVSELNRARFALPQTENAYLCWSVGFAKGVAEGAKGVGRRGESIKPAAPTNLKKFKKFYKTVVKNDDDPDILKPSTAFAYNAWLTAYLEGKRTASIRTGEPDDNYGNQNAYFYPHNSSSYKLRERD